MDYIFLPIALVMTAGWIFSVRIADRQTRRKLGGEIREVPLYRRGAIWLQNILIAVAVLLPAIMIYVGIRNEIPFGEIWIESVRSLWLLSIVYTLRKSSTLLVGDKGVGLGSLGVVEWNRIRELKWDRDIGQQQWGASITMEQNRSTIKHRLYVRRSIKPQLEQILLSARDPEGEMHSAIPTPGGIVQ